MKDANGEQAEIASLPTLLHMVSQACGYARASATALLRGIETHSGQSLDEVARYEETLDTLNRTVNDGVTQLIPAIGNELEARQLIACLKFIIELQRIGDLLLNVVNRFQAAGSRLASQDVQELAKMTAILAEMLDAVGRAFDGQDVPRALAVLREDAELDRLRNLTFVRHVENPEGELLRESYHTLFMSQLLERAGDHVKNLAEEICHLVTGRSTRHVLREYEKPIELQAVENRRKAAPQRIRRNG